MSENNGFDASEFATRDELLSESPRRFKAVDLPIRRRKIWIRSLLEHESEAFQAEMFQRGKVQKDKAVSSYRRLILLCTCHPGTDVPMFKPNDLDKLAEWDAADVNHAGKECELHCGFVEGEIEKTEKNFGSVPADK